jgi:hypothetical protein
VYLCVLAIWWALSVSFVRLVQVINRVAFIKLHWIVFSLLCE